MPDVSVTINKRPYVVSCAEGQEDHLRYLARIVDGKVGELISGMGQVGDLRLLVMAAILMADEVDDMRRESDRRVTEAKVAAVADIEKVTADDLTDLAHRLEKLAETLEQA